MSNTLKELQIVKSENEIIKNKVDVMETLMNKREQTERKNNNIISGIGKQSDNNNKDIVCKIGNALNVH